MEPTVSIIVPVYNTKPEFLKKCFDSIVSQTYSNIELIIVDDGSNIETAKYCDDYASGRGNVFVYHIENSGASVARNTGIQYSTGEYLTFIDSDDWVEKTYVERLISLFNDWQIDIVMCTRIFEYEVKSEINHFCDTDMVFASGNKEELVKKSMLTGIAGTWCKVYRKSFIIDNDLKYDPMLRRTQDIIFNLYAFQYARTVKYVDWPIYHYRMHNESVTKKYNQNADTILTKAAEAFSVYVNKYYSENESIKQVFYYKCLNILSEILKLKFFNSTYKIDSKKRFSELAEICKMDVYAKAINEIVYSTCLNLFGRYRVFCLKAKRYKLLYIPYGAKMVLEKRKNYK